MERSALRVWWSARREGCEAADRYHCGLMIRQASAMPSRRDRCGNVADSDRGVVVEGPVGSRLLGRFRAFRYELRCWRDGRIPDIAESVESPMRTTDDVAQAEALLDVLPEVPALTWGGMSSAQEMWNSNSAVSWALARGGHDVNRIHPPTRGRAPGWQAGLVLAERQDPESSPTR